MFFLVVGSTAAMGQDTSEDLAGDFLTRWRATMAEDATAGDVDRLLALYADSVVYEHPRVGVRIRGKEQIRGGMLRFLGGTRRPRITVAHRAIVPGVVVLELQVGFEIRRGDGWEPSTRRQVTVLEIQDRLIVRMIDYW